MNQRDTESVPRRPHGIAAVGLRIPAWRREALRTTLWLVPTVMVAGAVVLFVLTVELDLYVAHHHIAVPEWVATGGADAGRQVLVAIAAAVITVMGVVFSITILALTLASQQFGPRMMRTFVRDMGNQVTLGVWVATLVYAVLVLVAIGGPPGNFVPHISITVAEGLLLVDLAVLIYFIHHIAKSIQLPEVIAVIANDLMGAIDQEYPERPIGWSTSAPDAHGRPTAELHALLDEGGQPVLAVHSGYLQFVGHEELIAIAAELDCVIRLAYRPGHFVLAGRPLATVWPARAAAPVTAALEGSHVVGAQRTLMQDPVFAIDQLVEIAIRALSPAVNDTFTSLTCIDWLSAGLSQISGRPLVEGVHRDRKGVVRLIELDPSYKRMVDRAFDKVRQASRGMPAVMIRLMESIAHVMESTTGPDQRQVLLRQADMVLRAAEDDISEDEDLEDVRRRHRGVCALAVLKADSTST